MDLFCKQHFCTVRTLCSRFLFVMNGCAQPVLFKTFLVSVKKNICFLVLLVFNGPTYVYEKFDRWFLLNLNARLSPHQILNTINLSTKSFVEWFFQQYGPYALYRYAKRLCYASNSKKPYNCKNYIGITGLLFWNFAKDLQLSLNMSFELGTYILKTCKSQPVNHGLVVTTKSTNHLF